MNQTFTPTLMKDLFQLQTCLYFTFVLLGAHSPGVAQDLPKNDASAEAVSEAPAAFVIQRFEDPENLQSVTSTELSPDGNYVYAAAFNSDTANVWKRDPATGMVNRVQFLADEDMDAIVALRMAPNGKYMAGVSFKNIVTLFSRNPENGTLTYLSKVTPMENNAGELDFPIELRFSPDSRFVYVGCDTSLEVLQLQNDKLMGVQSEIAGGEVSGLRDVDVSPDGKYLYTTGGGSLLVFNRDEETGLVSLLQKLHQRDDRLSTLWGVCSVSCSADNRHVYLSAGRFTNRSAVTALRREDDGKLSVIEAWAPPGDPGDDPDADSAIKPKALGPDDFAGGNEIEVSPDGAEVWALGTDSDTAVRFQRDPESGCLTYIEPFSLKGDPEKSGPAGLCFSKDGRFVYIADEQENALVVIQRDLAE